MIPPFLKKMLLRIMGFFSNIGVAFLLLAFHFFDSNTGVARSTYTCVCVQLRRKKCHTSSYFFFEIILVLLNN